MSQIFRISRSLRAPLENDNPPAHWLRMLPNLTTLSEFRPKKLINHKMFRRLAAGLNFCRPPSPLRSPLRFPFRFPIRSPPRSPFFASFFAFFPLFSPCSLSLSLSFLTFLVEVGGFAGIFENPGKVTIGLLVRGLSPKDSRASGEDVIGRMRCEVL